ncbi:hypothetical protein ACVMB0_000050 [Bradyrhizobium sp. USDA 4451]
MTSMSETMPARSIDKIVLLPLVFQVGHDLGLR